MTTFLIIIIVAMTLVVFLLVWWLMRVDRTVDPKEILSEPLQRLEDATASIENAASALQIELERIRRRDAVTALQRSTRR